MVSKAAFTNAGEKRGVAPELQLGNLLTSAIEHLLLFPTPPPHSALSLPLNVYQNVFSYGAKTIS